MKNSKKVKKEQTNCTGSYEVSGYTTDSGKKVDSYTRNCWKHGNSIVSNSLNEGENPYPNTIFEYKIPEENPYPTEELPPQEKSTKDKVNEEIQNIIKILIDNLDNTQYFNNSLPPYSPVPNTFSEYKFRNNNNNQPFSTFDSKSTKDKIQESTKSVEEILKNSENINNQSLNEIKTKVSKSIEGLCKDCENVIKDKNNQPEIPTWESAQKGKGIETNRKDIIDNTPNAIIMLNLMDNLYNKEFKKINTTYESYFIFLLPNRVIDRRVIKNVL